MTTYSVSSASEFSAALGKVAGGDSIVLAAGNYGSAFIQNLNPASNVTIQAASGAAVHFDGLTVVTSQNLTFSGFDVGRALNATEPDWTRLSCARDSSNLTFDHMKFHGSLDGDPSNDGIGLYSTNVTGLKITNSEFTDLYQGAVAQTSTGVSIANNNFHLIRSDGIISFGNDQITIDSNAFSDFHPVLGDHADMIQFFNVGLNKGASDIVVQNNTFVQTYYSGIDQTGVQGIWITDGGTYGYNNVLVKNNLLYSNYMYNGLSVMGATNTQIIGNTVVSDPTNTMQFWIRLEGDNGVLLQDNVTDNILQTNVTNVTMTNNINLHDTPAALALFPDIYHNQFTVASDLVIAGGPGYHPDALPGSTIGLPPPPAPAPAPAPAPPPPPPPTTVYGTSGSDSLTGTNGADRMYGFAASDPRLGRGSVDKMWGGAGADTFVLGDARGVFYTDGSAKSAGKGDYAQIMDFTAGVDKIQLAGSMDQYFLKPGTVNNLSGVQIFFDSNHNGVFDSRDELIGHVAGVKSLAADSFVFG